MVRFTSVVSGGSGPYALHWEVANHSLGSGANTSYTFQTPGMYVVYLWVNDSGSSSRQGNHSSATIIVLPPATGPGTPALNGDELLALGAAMILLAFGLLIAVRRRKPPPTGSPANQTRPRSQY